MTLEIGILFGILLVMAFFFFTEKLPVDLTAFMGLAAMVLGGFVAPDQAFTGFASPAVITMLSVFIRSRRRWVSPTSFHRVYQFIGIVSP